MTSPQSAGKRVPQLNEIEFALRDQSYPIVKISAENGCRIDLLETVPAISEDHRLHLFVRVQNTDPETALDLARQADRGKSARVVQQFEEELICELITGDGCFAWSLWEAGTLLRSATAIDGTVRITVVLPPDRDPDAVAEAAIDENPSLNVTAVRERPLAAPLMTKRGFQRILKEQLTNRQWTTLRLAFAGGYFNRPREITQTELANELGISQETVSQHLRAAQQQLFTVLFEQGVLE